jgi:Uma2 family endonuclease
MVQSGVFTKRDRFVLINGYLVTKVTKNPPHVLATDNVRDLLKGLISSGWWIRIEAPVRLPPKSEPEPDVSTARGDKNRYTNRHPGPSDLALVVEVSDATLDDDRDLVAVYGPAGIAIYWIVNLVDQQVEVYTGPSPEGYSSCEVFEPGQSLPVVLDGVEVGRIDVADFLPPVDPAAKCNGA